MDEAIKKKVDDFSKRLKDTTLGINYVPAKYKKRFVELAKEEFKDDYGLCLRELIKTYDSFYPKGTEEQDAKIDLLADEINQIKEKLDSLKVGEPEALRETASGRKIIKGE